MELVLHEKLKTVHSNKKTIINQFSVRYYNQKQKFELGFLHPNQEEFNICTLVS